ncbi:ribonuclease activity regulator RraA [Bordetella hinzii]|uniref:Ribonuclease activity regulator RraA n=2 Tax=Bordetella hinzii TaxID=103855 RepID=A0AAN1RZK1_9BORD|nr:ribonuclease activity regulator RraA [Bordetella hinzii]AKQ55769.1 4-hydroxy-4-methyl-2-oxoglutarate aldolase [Bordetella hinzii]AKQ60302.1 4-hydroxy-4-methyl-2-oxoglutarate aldolase [Bordetella hinzii]AZW18630.1 ribonuclease activity regulator RraA [Bordetella hinzii]KCB31514.1 demethylmenaquinone methyltransferase [Bordetella hinzii L60]KCB34193.1 demethylmenaquinone methyltransferase [Bordetella hinzii CA90 BAL1384]
MSNPVSDALRQQLSQVSIATLSTALFKRGFRNTVIQGVLPVNPGAPRMVGAATTLRYIPSREDIDHVGVFADPENAQRKVVEHMPAGNVLVIDSRADAGAASAGSILINRLKVRGVRGIVTDGGFRDTPELQALDYPVYCARPSAPTNLTRHHAADIDLPIGCGGVPVYPGDVIVGDAEGVIVIPAHLVQEIADEASEMTVFEDYVTERVRAGASTFGLYPPSEAAKAVFEAWQRDNHR